VLDRNLADPEVYSRMANAYWDSVIASRPEAVTETASAAENLSAALPPPPAVERKPESFQESALHHRR